jgi:hypothetical protein
MNKVEVVSIITAITIGLMHAIRYHSNNKNKK